VIEARYGFPLFLVFLLFSPMVGMRMEKVLGEVAGLSGYMGTVGAKSTRVLFSNGCMCSHHAGRDGRNRG
jgi:hypothetical protein